MNQFRTSVVAAAGPIALTMTFALTGGQEALAQNNNQPRPAVTIVNDETSPVPVAEIRPAAERVQLQTELDDGGVCSFNQRAVRRLLPDGAAIPAFTVPAGKILVLTDFRGEAVEDPAVGWSVGSVVRLRVTVGPDTLHPQLIARAVVTTDTAASGIVAMDAQSQSGVYGSSGLAVCVGAVMIGDHGSLQARANVGSAQIEGYLIPE